MLFLFFVAGTNLHFVGFSTWTEIDVERQQGKALVVFSGDTVIEKAYWGNKDLQKSFAKKMFATKQKNPHWAVFWLLISKGFKLIY